jgi:hypothetical protein
MFAHLLGAVPFHLVPPRPAMRLCVCIHLIDIYRVGLILPHALLSLLFLRLLPLLRC